ATSASTSCRLKAAAKSSTMLMRPRPSLRADALEKADEGAVERLPLLQDHRVAAGEKAEARAANQLGERARVVGRREDVVLAGDDERGHLVGAEAREAGAAACEDDASVPL